MKKYFVLLLFAGLFVTVSSAWASNDDKNDKATAKVETTVKKADAPKQTTTAACCAAETKTACCATAATAACCTEKKADTKATACTNLVASYDTKSSGKKTN